MSKMHKCIFDIAFAKANAKEGLRRFLLARIGSELLYARGRFTQAASCLV